MTLPLTALGNNPYDESDASVPAWRKAALKLGQQYQTQQTIANSPYSSTAQMDPIGQLTTGLSTIGQMGDQATLGAQQSANKRRDYYNKYTQDVFNYQQAKSQADFQKSAQQQITAMQTQYQTAINGIPGQQQYTSPGVSNPGNTTPGNTTPGDVQYSGQASQVAAMARKAGFPEAVIPTVVAISQAESSGKADATHVNTDKYGSTDLGLMQINDHWHKDLLANYDWRNPQQNMEMAYQIWKGAGGSFTPWSTFNSGDYNKYLGMGQTAASYIQPAGPVGVSAQTTSGLRQTIINKAETYIGLPYVWGGTDLSKGVDCSGLVQQVYAKFGINLPRVSADQSTGHLGKSTYGVRTSVSSLEPGDLVYFYHSDGQVHHIAIWLGKNQILEAPYTGANVRIRTLGPNDVPHGLHLYGLDPTAPSPATKQASKTGASQAY